MAQNVLEILIIESFRSNIYYLYGLISIFLSVKNLFKDNSIHPMRVRYFISLGNGKRGCMKPKVNYVVPDIIHSSFSFQQQSSSSASLTDKEKKIKNLKKVSVTLSHFYI